MLAVTTHCHLVALSKRRLFCLPRRFAHKIAAQLVHRRVVARNQTPHLEGTVRQSPHGYQHTSPSRRCHRPHSFALARCSALGNASQAKMIVLQLVRASGMRASSGCKHQRRELNINISQAPSSVVARVVCARGYKTARKEAVQACKCSIPAANSWR